MKKYSVIFIMALEQCSGIKKTINEADLYGGK